MLTNSGTRLAGKTVFITGSEKNAGKTTFLNYALKSLRHETSPAFLTIGVDGEQKDTVFGNPKPQIYTEPGDLFVTSDSMIKKSGGVFEIREVFPFTTVLGRLVLLKTVREGFIELVGPEDNRQLSRAIRYIKENEGVNTLLIDGAVNRITQVAAATSGTDAGFVFVTRISPHNMKNGIDKIKRLSIMENIRRYTGPDNSSEVWFHKGALTESSIHKIPEEIQSVVIDDVTKIFISYHQLKYLQSGKALFFRNIFDLLFIVVNLIDIEKDEFLKRLAETGVSGKIVFNPYQLDI